MEKWEKKDCEGREAEGVGVEKESVSQEWGRKLGDKWVTSKVPRPNLVEIVYKRQAQGQKYISLD